MIKTAFTITIFTLLSVYPISSWAMNTSQTTLEMGDNTSVVQKLNINKADVKQLTQINGLGKKKAEAIVSYINQHGKLTSLEQLVNVKGIGSKLVVKLSPYLTVK